MTSKRNDVVDAWRGILIGCVLIYHYTVCWAQPEKTENIYHYDHAFPAILRLGGYGVEVFFAISGLVITMTLLRSHDTLDFVFRRFSRLFPAAAAAATITFLATSLHGPTVFHRSWQDLLFSYTLMAPAFGGNWVDDAYWSLFVELKFYAICAAGYLLLRHLFWAFVLGVALTGLVFSMVWTKGASLLLAPYMAFFLAGMAIWYWLYDRDTKIASILGTGAATALFATGTQLPLHHVSAALAVTAAVATTLIMIGTIALRITLPLGPLPYLGRISYSLYLVHQNIGVTVIAFLKTHAAMPDWGALVIAALISLALAVTVFHSIEQPAQGWLRKLYYAGRPHLLTAKTARS